MTQVEKNAGAQEAVAGKKPLPVPDALTAGYWKAAAAHVLAIQRCDHCGNLAHPPTVVCTACQSTRPAFSFAPVSGRGRIHTWTVMRDSFLPSFKKDIPWVVAMIELEEQKGVQVMANLKDGANAKITIGTPVEVVFDDVAPGVALPQFRLAGGAK